MKINTATTATIEKPFHEDGNVIIITQHEKNKITGFKVTNKQTKKTETFTVKKFNILEAWKQVERFFAGKK